MKLINLTCPNCGAKLEVNSELTKCTCNYCGGEVLVDNEKVVVEHSEKSGYNFARGMYRAQMEFATETKVGDYPVRVAAKVQGKSVLYLLLMLVSALIVVGMFAYLKYHDISNLYVTIWFGIICLTVMFYKKYVAYKNGGAYLVKCITLTNKRVIISYVNKPDEWIALTDLIEVREGYFGSVILRTYNKTKRVVGIKDLKSCVNAICDERDKYFVADNM